jgi:hypothetical protein
MELVFLGYIDDEAEYEAMDVVDEKLGHFDKKV